VALIVVAGFLLIIGTYAGLLAGAPARSGPPTSALLLPTTARAGLAGVLNAGEGR